MLTESLKKVSLEEDFFGGDDFFGHDENVNLENIEEEMASKNIEDLMNKSSLKAEKRMEMRK